MTRLWFVRHGPTHAKTMTGWTDLPADLSDHAALARLRAYLPQAPIIASDLIRATATAKAVQGSRQIMPPDPRLREINFGTWEGLRHDQIPDQALARKFWEQPGSLAPPDGESWDQMQARTSNACDTLCALGLQDIIIICHMGPILSQLQRAQATTGQAVFAQVIAPLSATTISYGAALNVVRTNHIA
ncbi:MAG: histidine phosphatase family protein [Rhodobacteraceae bacterium]|nr:histidine phosphatase family protein [Paracoccaceae bacterium]